MRRWVIALAAGVIAVLATVVVAPSAAAAAPATAPYAPLAAPAASTADFTSFCPYKLRPGVTAVNIRSGPSRRFPRVDVWVAPQVRFVGEPPHIENTFWREIGPGRWVDRTFIVGTGGPCALP